MSTHPTHAGPRGRQVSWRGEVLTAWIDRNRHFNVGYYMVAFDLATTAYFDYTGVGTDEYRQHSGTATYAVESHATYERELPEHAPLLITTQLLGFDSRKIHYFHRMYHAEEGFLAATNELLSLHVDTATSRAVTMPPELVERLQELQRLDDATGRPSRAGRRVGLDQPRPGS